MARDIPIIFSAPMVQALLAGRKTQTRRLASRILKNGLGKQTDSSWQEVKAGDRLYVRESFYIDLMPWDRGRLPETPPPGWSDHCYFRADGECCAQIPECQCLEVGKPRWRPSIHMPRWASRLTLVVTAVKIEPLQQISDDDAVAEGLWYCEEGDAAGFWFASPDMKEAWGEGSVDCYMRLWQHLHGEASWDANPEVVAITFTVHKENIDALGR